MNFYNFMIRSYRYEESTRGILARAMIFNRPILPHVDRGEFGDRGYMAWKSTSNNMVQMMRCLRHLMSVGRIM
nr:MAG TPA: hypothetical protein [Caudoviricetes sp.]